ncbi:hypothetical protein RZS08_01745, partial [Arthrospira platensis SPKY1]|nr:hypothetical protein [Arthrospira platensis SPKY1]
DFGYVGTRVVKLTGANKTITNKEPACIDRQGRLKAFGSLMNLDFTNGQATCQMVLYKVELAHIDAESGALSSLAELAHGLDVEVLPADTGVASAMIDALPNPVVLNGTVNVA